MTCFCLDVDKVIYFISVNRTFHFNKLCTLKPHRAWPWNNWLCSSQQKVAQKKSSKYFRQVVLQEMLINFRLTLTFLLLQFLFFGTLIIHGRPIDFFADAIGCCRIRQMMWCSLKFIILFSPRGCILKSCPDLHLPDLPDSSYYKCVTRTEFPRFIATETLRYSFQIAKFQK